jgi:hypothetical protein
MADIKIAIINQCTALTDGEIAAAVPALQAQIHEHFAPVWGIDADLVYVGTAQPAPGCWWLVILDNSDQQGALGYHDLTDEGLPIGKVFAATDKANKLNWTITASHELLEMLADPDISLTVFLQPDNSSGTLYSYEVCDACEDDQFGYNIGDIFVSDFVFPAWFEASRPAESTQFDYAKQLHAPVPTLLSGGYIGAFDVTAGTGWHQVTAEERLGRAFHRPRAGGRHDRRRTPRDQWRNSEPTFR